MFEEFKEFHDYERKSCLVCGSTENNIWAKHEYFSAVQCNHCKFVFMNPSVNEDGMNKYYSDYIGDRFKKQKKMEQRKVQYTIDAEFVERYINTGNILDVGCNGGFFLSEISDNFNKFGIEIDSDAVSYAQKNYNFDIRNAEIGNDDFEENQFDLIIFRGVIEHMLDPAKALKRSHELLKNGGLIYFCATPNLKCIGADFYREKWNLWHPIEHINIFDADTLHQLLGVNNYDLLAADYQYLGTPYENYEQDNNDLINDIKLKADGRWDEVQRSKPFWGNMMSLIYKKNNL
jgi:SAM-dependent methyltransferase